VVQLEHLRGEESGWITSTYHLTEQVKGHLTALRHALTRPNGVGVFVIGHYGSGKSHFLAYLAQGLSSGELPGADQRPRVVTVSLLNFRAEVPLEDVITQALGIAGKDADRRLAWSDLGADSGAGTVLLIDELSEFLRSKATRQAFNEDVRFLQYMGEWAQSHRFWVLAAMQEQIEHTGALESSLYRKIKDRFPLRLLLTPEHVRDLLADSILEREPGCEEAVAELAAEMKRALPDAGIDYQALQDLYPIHPATLELLEEVRELFSQTRGIVDFAMTRLLGDPGRGVEPFLDRPWGDLLTPEAIIDHFADLFEVQPEFLPLAQRFLPYYRKQADSLFDTEAQKVLGWRVLKLLMLDYISPQREGLRPADASAWLLFRATTIAPARNLQIVERMLQRLAAEGRYIRESRGHYQLDLRDDSAERLEAWLKREQAELETASDEAVWETILPVLGDKDFNPFTLPRDTWHPRVVRWHMHERPYSVFFGNGQAVPGKGIQLCIRLPWGSTGPATGITTILPNRLELSAQLYELAALLRLAEKPSNRATQKLLQRRIEERRGLFVTQVRNAYLEARMINPEGGQDAPRRISPTAELREWLDSYALGLLKRTFPRFEVYAPSHGPLTRESYSTLMRVAASHDLGEYEGDEHIKIIREAYLVPMGLLRREGWSYKVPARLDQNELIKLVMPMLDHRPAPRVIYDHLSGPVYGLVEDQIHLLLIFLLLQGEIEILKGSRSFQELHVTLPDPRQYDRVEPGRGLGIEQLKALEELCVATGVRVPKQWTVMAQRKAIKGLRKAADKQRQRLHPVLLRLKQVDPECALIGKLSWLLSALTTLTKGKNELQAMEQLLYEIGSTGRFITELQQVEDLPERLTHTLAELRRFRHLLADPVLVAWGEPAIQTRFEALGEVPGLDDYTAVQDWLQQARSAYEAYCIDYRKRHDAWWQEVAYHPVWSWQPPAVASSRHLALGEELTGLGQSREWVQHHRCQGLTDLDYRPQCGCGFDGQQAAVADRLQVFDGYRKSIEKQLRLFFQQDSVKDQIRSWKEQGLEVTRGTLDYLEDRQELPDIKDLGLFDQHLAGLELVQELELDRLTGIIGDGLWQPEELLAALTEELQRYRGKRLRFIRPQADGIPDQVVLWCVEQSLTLGVPLPAGLPAEALARIATEIHEERVTTDGLLRLGELGLGTAVEDRIITWLLDGVLSCELPDQDQGSPVLQAVLEMVQPSRVESPVELARLSELLYSQHQRLQQIAGARWQERLAALAAVELQPPPPGLIEVLEERLEMQWLVIDCLGLPLLSIVDEVAEVALSAWHRTRTLFARVSATTTTDGCYRQLAEAGIEHELHKANAVDRVLHERRAGFNDIRSLVVAELQVALRGLVRKLDPAQPLLLFADHGFRISADGKELVHGGASTLERTVPVIEYQVGQGSGSTQR
jgi:hypothetical protein